MWRVQGLNLSMAEEDYGIVLPVTVSGTTLGSSDSVLFVIRKTIDGDTLVQKNYDGITQNTVPLELTQAESSLLPVGQYVYRLDWYQSGSFMCNLVPYAEFRVVNKA